LYDVKVDVEDPSGGSVSSTELGEFTVMGSENTDPFVNWIRAKEMPGLRLDPGGIIETGSQIRMWSEVGDAETPSSDLTVYISYRPQGGEWTTEAATYNDVWDFWLVFWDIPEDAETGLYDIKVDVEDLDGGSVSSTELGEFSVA
jgi:hypothetical protein